MTANDLASDVMKHIHYALLPVLLFCCGLSEAKDLYTVGGASSSTSDDIDLDTLHVSYISNRRSHFWPYVEDASSNRDWGVMLYRYSGQANGTHFDGQQLEGVLGWRFSDRSYLGGRIGAHRLDVPSQDNEKVRLTYDLDANIGVTGGFTLRANAASDYVYQLGIQPAGVREYLHAKKWLAGFEWKPVAAIRISGSGSRWDLSDDNTRQDTLLKVVYVISRDWPWIWAGVSYEDLRYDMVKPDYWSPQKFRSLGLVFESSFPISENFSGDVSASLSRIKEDDFPEGDGSSLFVGVNYKLGKDVTIRFGFSRIRSQQNNSNWNEDAYHISLNGNF